MALIKCAECGKDISDKAASCPSCGNPLGPATKTVVQLDTAPHKRRKYKVRYLYFAPMFLIGSLFALGSIFSGSSSKFALWAIVGFVGFVGMIYSAIGHWLAEP